MTSCCAPLPRHVPGGFGSVQPMGAGRAVAPRFEDDGGLVHFKFPGNGRLVVALFSWWLSQPFVLQPGVDTFACTYFFFGKKVPAFAGIAFRFVSNVLHFLFELRIYNQGLKDEKGDTETH
jgi:hypothetical protein